MNTDEIVKIVKEKVGLDDGLAGKVGEFLKGQSFVGNANKNSIIAGLKEKVGVSDEIADKIYNAVAEALASGVFEKIKGIFGK